MPTIHRQHGKRRMIIAFDQEPDEDAKGGPWYDSEKRYVDVALIDLSRRLCKLWVPLTFSVDIRPPSSLPLFTIFRWHS